MLPRSVRSQEDNTMAANRIERVVITGAGSGIGFDLARRFVAAGSRVVLNGRDPGKLEAARAALGAGDRVIAVAGHIGHAGTATSVAEAARRHFGGVDVLVNNAGIFQPKPFLESTEQDLERFFETNVKGTYLMTQAVVPMMIKDGGGSIINIGTVLVEQGMAGLPVSAAMTSKGGVHALTVSLAAELARHSIRVNTLAPGIIRTPLIGDDADSMAAIHPLGRIGEVRDTTDAAMFLATAGFVSGMTLDVDGGYSHAR
jgi:NAD(P)-dependent dehydrogenase (short-subunit alcohol dehydrogenase family)